MATIGINYTVEDDKALRSSFKVYIPLATTLADAQEYALALADNLTGFIRGVIVNVTLTYNLDISALLGNTMIAGCDVEEGARFVWNVNGGFKASNRIPAVSETIIVPNSRAVDTTDANVSAFIDKMVTGFTCTSTNVVSACDYRGADITDIASAVESFVASRKLKNA